MKSSFLSLTANTTSLPTTLPPLPPRIKTANKPPVSRSRGIDRALSISTALITLLGCIALLRHAHHHGFNFLSQKLTATVAATGPASSLLSFGSQSTEPSLSGTNFGTFVMSCEDEWYGRTGNNIISVFSAALRAHALGMDFKVVDCPHELLDLSELTLKPGDDLSSLKIKDMINAYDAFTTFVVSTKMRIFPKEACCLKKRILAPLLTKVSTSPAASKYHPDSLIIHIRSGDIYRKPVNPNYSPPPLAYYQKVIDEHQSRHSSMGSTGANIVIVTELERVSPLVDALLKLYPEGTITLQAGTLEEDVAVVLAARHLVASQGTFAYALAYASRNLETLYVFNTNLDTRVYCDINLIRYKAQLPPFMETWTASSEQIQYLLEFPAENLARTTLLANKGYCNTV